MSERTYSGFPGFPGPKPDARLASEDARSICVYCRRATPDGYDEHPECVERAAESGLAERSFDAQDSLLGGQVLGSSVTLGASHVPDESGDRPEVVRKFVGSGDAHAEDGLSPAPPLDDLRVTESLGGVFAGVPISSEAVGRSGDSGDDCFHNPILPYVSSRGDAGPDAETLAETVREGVSAAEVPLGVVSAAFSALSGLVALVEQRERERDDQRTRRYELAADATRKCTEFRERAQKAEALLARHRQALELAKRAKSQAAAPFYDEEAVRDLLWATVNALLAASAPGTEEPA